METIGVIVTKERPKGLKRTEFKGKHCEMVGRARKGECLYVENGDITCPLARYNLGLERFKNLQELAKILVGWGDAIDEEKALKYLKSLSPLPYSQKFIVYFPYPHPTLIPQILVMIGNPEQIMPLTREYTAITGERIKAFISGIGGMCGECTSIPLSNGKPNLSVGCGGSRPGVKLLPEEMFLAFPYDCSMRKVAENYLIRRKLYG